MGDGKESTRAASYPLATNSRLEVQAALSNPMPPASCELPPLTGGGDCLTYTRVLIEPSSAGSGTVCRHGERRAKKSKPEA